jgi:hypothetical protein
MLPRRTVLMMPVLLAFVSWVLSAVISKKELVGVSRLMPPPMNQRT